MPHLLVKASRALSTTFRRLSTSCKSLRDSYGRHHNYLRISLTERCNLRCQYCMPDEGVNLTPKEKCLNIEELKRVTKLLVRKCGITKIRLTGGEPTVDSKLLPLLGHLNELRLDGLETVGMTTNGLTLSKKAHSYKILGLNAINISLDTLQKDRFEKLTRRKGLHLVQAGIESAVECGFDAVKVNCVVIDGVNDDEILEFVSLAERLPIEVRFIEYMPFKGNRWTSGRVVAFATMLGRVRERYPDISRYKSALNDVSKVYKSKSLRGSIGFITSMSDKFCSGCNRMRITADGNLKVCLFGRDETSLRDLMRNGASDDEIIGAISSALGRKLLEHPGSSVLDRETFRPMIKIGSRFIHTGSRNLDELRFSHLDEKGDARMVDVGSKDVIRRTAIASGRIYVGEDLLPMIREKKLRKGDVITVSRLAGIMGAKWTSSLIPLCHQIPLNLVEVKIEMEKEQSAAWLLVTGRVETHGRTGVEMEALTAVTITLLTIYDMCKSVSKSMVIGDVRLISKTKEPIEGQLNSTTKRTPDV